MLALYYRYYMLPHLITAKDAEKAFVKRSSKLTFRGGTRTLCFNLLTSFLKQHIFPEPRWEKGS